MNELSFKIKNVIKKLFDADFEPEITPAPKNTQADFSSNVAMKLAGILKRNPREIAEAIAQEFDDIKVEIAGPGFLNFTLSDQYFVEKINALVRDFDSSVANDTYAGKTVICEFSDPNPFKVLHVGHLYTSIVGDSIARLFEYAGAKVVRANFGGDVGLHVGKTMWALLKSGMKEFTIEDIAAKYVEGTKAYEDDEEAKEQIIKINKCVYEIANLTEENAGEYDKLAGKYDFDVKELAKMYWQGRELSYKYFEDFYQHIGVKFDKYYPESTVVGRGPAEVKKGLEQGVYEMSDGAVVYRGDEKLGLHTRVFINKEGLPTYEAKDVGLIYTKWDDYHFDKSVVITGNDIIDYMKIVLASVGEMNPELVERTTHLTHGQVKLQGSVKMSSRKGNFLKAVDVLNMITEELKSEYNSEDEKIVLGATKYAFLKYKMGGDIIFEPKESVKMTGNSGPYLLYASLRAKKVLEKVQNMNGAWAAELAEPERNLIKKVIQYKDVLEEAVTEMAPHKICSYLYELAQEFSRFYENCPVVGSEFETSRAKITVSYYKTMLHGLNLLGMVVPEEM